MLILDTDGGVDDAQALMMLLAAGRAPDMITTVAGNVGVAAATRNILSVLAVAGHADIPVHMGAARALVQAPTDATRIHGADGLGGAPRPDVVPEPASQDGIGALIAQLRRMAETGKRAELLMIGPLTNLALVLRRAPDCAAGLGRITLMGGTIHGRGNVTPAAEFNIFADPEAAAIVFAAEVAMVIVPWETCATHMVTGTGVDGMFDGVPDGPAKRFSRALADHARATIQSHGGGDTFRFVDPMAAAVVIEPAIITKSLQASVDVALAPGLTRGMTVVDPTGRLGTPKRTFVEAVDLDRLSGLYRNSLGYHAGGDDQP